MTRHQTWRRTGAARRRALELATGLLLILGLLGLSAWLGQGDALAQAPPAQAPLHQLFEALEPCPAFEQVLAQALHAQGLNRLDDDLAARARAANLLPRVELDLSVARRDQHMQRYREDFLAPSTGQLTRDLIRQDVDERAMNDRGARIRLRWELGRALYDPQELLARRMTLQQRQARAKLIELVARHYWTRRKHQLERLMTRPDDVEALIHHTIQIELLGAQLDGLTRGWFHRQLAAMTQKTKEDAR